MASHSRRQRLVVVVLAAVLAPLSVLMATPIARADATPSPSSDATAVAGVPAAGVPVLGSTPVQLFRTSSRGLATALVHGVRRIPGGTVLYYSFGAPEGSAPFTYYDYDRVLISGFPYAGGVLGPLLVDVAGAKVYAALTTPGKRRAELDQTYSFSGPAGVFYTMYAVMPELPPSVTSVNVVLAEGEVALGIPVESGLLEPAVPGTAPVPLGSGWPTVDQAMVAGASATTSMFDLSTSVSDLGSTVTTRAKGSTISVDLAADVLFAVDSATLSGQAGAKIRAAADAVNAGAAAGTVSVVGYTDSTGTSAHNVDLSRRRAAAVAAALRPLVRATGVSLAVDGKGEADPVATNDTAEGRQANRRVSITFAKAHP
jgi:outer membrane protein OmpA-like peptidoglycan-associated protein